MRMTLPHEIGADEVRRRLKERSHEIADQIPGGMATVETHWPNEDLMQLSVDAMGQHVTGSVAIAEDNVVIDYTLPASLSFFKPIIEKALQSNGQKLLEKPD